MKNRPLFVVFMIVLLDLIGYGILIPVIPQLFNEGGEFFLRPGDPWFLQTRFIILGLLTASYPIAQFFASPILGQLSDRYGRKKILAISIAGTCLSYVIFAIGIHFRNIPIIFLSRIFDGMTGGNIATAQAVIADTSTPANRQKNFGLIGAAFGLGFVLGPFLGGILSSKEVMPWFDATTPFDFAAILSFINIVLVLTILPETNLHLVQSIKLTFGSSLRNIKKVFALRSTTSLFITSFLLQSGFTFYTTFASLYLAQQFQMSEKSIGLFFAYVGIWIVITQGFIIRKISGKVPEYKIVRFALFCIAIALAIYPAIRNPTLLLIIVPFYAIPLGLANATIISLVSRSVGPNNQGEILGVNSSVLALAQSLPPIISGMVAAKLSPAASISTASLIVLAGGFYFWHRYYPHQASSESAPINPELPSRN